MPQGSLCPDGIDSSHSQAKGWHRHANPAAILALGLLLSAALAGVFGGQPHPTRTIVTSSATVKLQLPERIRNGMFFEMRAEIETKRKFEDLTVAISSIYWRDLTVNSMIPGPTDEKSENGRYLFSYGPIDANQTVTIKIDGQINPPLFAGNSGEILLMDGDAVIAIIPVKMNVLP